MVTPGEREMDKEEQNRIGLIAGRAFTPGSSIKERDVFSGRTSQIRRVIDAITQEGKSALIYGERGVGKTSLANVIDDFYLSVANARIFAPHIACDSEDSFHDIWMKVVGEKDRKRPSVGLSEQVSTEVDEIIHAAGGKLTPHDIRSIADVIAQTHLFIPIIDEFDRLKDPYAIALFTDTIKYISDHTQNTTLILVGVGDTVDDLISEHRSVERALEQVLMPRMTAKESAMILAKGSDTTGVKFSDDAAALIVSLAKGLPHYTHLLGLHATRAAVDQGSWLVLDRHVEAATESSIVGSQQSLRRAYHTATTSPRPDNLFKQVLLACALSETDELGYFAAADVRSPMSKIMGKPYDIPSYSQHLKQFCTEDRGQVLQKIGPDRKTRFRFNNPLLQPFVVLNGIKDGFIAKEDVRGLFQIGPDYDDS